MKLHAEIGFQFQTVESARRLFVGMKPLLRLPNDSRGAPALSRMFACSAEVPQPPFWILLIKGSPDRFFRKARLSRLGFNARLLLLRFLCHDFSSLCLNQSAATRRL